MNGHITVVHPYKGILLSNKKEQTIDTVTKESQMHQAKWKKPNSKGYTCLILFLCHSIKGKAIEAKWWGQNDQSLPRDQSVTSRGQHGGILEADCGGGYLTLHICQKQRELYIKKVNYHVYKFENILKLCSVLKSINFLKSYNKNRYHLLSVYYMPSIILVLWVDYLSQYSWKIIRRNIYKVLTSLIVKYILGFHLSFFNRKCFSKYKTYLFQKKRNFVVSIIFLFPFHLFALIF